MKENNPKGFWQSLERIPGLTAVQAEWRTYMGEDFESTKGFLRPNGKLASSHPCMIQPDCGCYHDVVIHGDDDIVAVCHCERGCEIFALKKADITVYELNRNALETLLVEVFKLFTESKSDTDIRGTILVGVYSPFAGFRFPVYLTMQLEIDDFKGVVDALLGRNNTSFILLIPTRDHLTARTEKLLMDKKSIIVVLSENVVITDKRQIQLLRPIDNILSEFLDAIRSAQQAKDGIAQITKPAFSKEANPEERIVLKRMEINEEVHWIVNGTDKGRFYVRAETKKAKIIEVLYDQIEKGWVPHKTFMNGCAWSPKEYYRANDEPGCMQRQLTEIRKFLEVQIEFNKAKGVRFAENVVKSRE